MHSMVRVVTDIAFWLFCWEGWSVFVRLIDKLVMDFLAGVLSVTQACYIIIYVIAFFNFDYSYSH